MESQVNAFIQMVRNSRIKQPTQRGFSSRIWKEHFSTITTPTENDCRLYEDGLWFDLRLSEIRNSFEEFSDPEIPVDMLLKLYVGMVNRDTKVTFEAISKAYSQSSSKTVFVGQIAEQRLVIGNNRFPIHPTGAIESSVSAVRHILAQLLSKENSNTQKKSVANDEILRSIATRMNLAVLYDDLLYYWNECLWNGWHVEIGTKQDLIVPPSHMDYVSRVVTEHRADCLLYEFAWWAQQLWRDLPNELRQIEQNRQYITDFGRKGKRKYLELGNIVDINNPPPAYAIRITAEELYWNEILNEPLPALDNLTIRNILLVWDVLASLGDVFWRRLPNNTTVMKAKTLLEFAPTVQIPQLCKSLSEATGLPFDKVSSILNFLTFSGNVRDDPWVKPLISIGNGSFVIIIVSLRSPNLVRSIEHWMRDGGINLEKRGEVFEQFVRDEITQDINKSEHWKRSRVIQTSIEFHGGESFEEIDLVWIVGTLIFIGEIKCFIYPTSPIERHNYYKVLHEAVGQAKRKAKFIEELQGKFLSQISLTNEIDSTTLKIYPIVITNLPIGVGFPIDDVPVVDLKIIGKYIEGFQEFFVETSSKGKEHTHQVVQYYSNEFEAEKNLLTYLKTPPLMSIFTQFLDTEIIPLLMVNKRDKPRGYIRLFVNVNKIQNQN